MLHQELKRHLKREYAKLLTLLQAYAIIAAGVRIICTNQVGRAGHWDTMISPRVGHPWTESAAAQVGTGARTKVISTQGLASMRDNIVTIFGSRTFEALTPVSVEADDGLAIHG